MQLLGSIDHSYKELKKILHEKKKSFPVDRLMLKRLIYLLRPFKHAITIIQKGNEPSLYLVLICVLTLRKALSSFDNLNKFNQENDNMSSEQKENDEYQHDLESEELAGKFNHYDRWTFK